MDYMFSNCTRVTSLNLLNFRTSSVTDMGYMFRGCSQLTTLDLSTFTTSRVSDMGSMFNGCSNLTTVYVSTSWTNAAVTTSGSTFSSCTKIVGQNGTRYSTLRTSATYARIDYGTPEPGYFTVKGGIAVKFHQNVDSYYPLKSGVTPPSVLVFPNGAGSGVGAHAYNSQWGTIDSVALRQNHGFKGWFTAKTGGTYVSSSAMPNNFTSNTIYFAHWKGVWGSTTGSGYSAKPASTSAGFEFLVEVVNGTTM